MKISYLHGIIKFIDQKKKLISIISTTNELKIKNHFEIDFHPFFLHIYSSYKYICFELMYTRYNSRLNILLLQFYVNEKFIYNSVIRFDTHR